MMDIENYENFTDVQHKVLERYVTNTRSNIFVLINLPEVIKGALFSRYSRSNLGLRSLLLKEFISDTEQTGFEEMVGSQESTTAEQLNAIRKAQNFYDRILDGYGDDSIGELGGAHLAIENVSMLAAKGLEDCRIGGSPLEKSTRYIYFDQKVDGEYLFYREPVLMTSAFRDLYVDTCNMLFETYSRLIPPLTEIFEKKFPQDPNASKVAYSAALRAKVLDCLRGLLPAGTFTNMGVFGNGRFYEQLIHKLHCQNLAEMQDIGKKMYEELNKVIPSFIRRSDITHKTHQNYAQFYEAMNVELRQVANNVKEYPQTTSEIGVTLVDYDHDAEINVAAGLLFANSHHSLHDIKEYCRSLPEEELQRILDAACLSRETRRHKSPRGLEHVFFTFEILGDFGAYRDLHRHRLLTQERQLLNCDYGFYVPKEIVGTPYETDYAEAMIKAKAAFDQIRGELPEEAQYIVPMAYNVRWYFKVNLRGLQWMCELRSSPAGHPNYRQIAQSMAKQVCSVYPSFERFFKFVDYEGYDMGRMGQEQRKAEKQMTVG
jgi:thymidylate synthase ThyX